MDEFVDLVKRAQSRGYYVITCDGYKDGPAKTFSDKSYTIDVRDTDAIAMMCRDEKVDGIISSFSDVLAECLVAIAEKAGLPSYLTPDRLRLLRDKGLMKGMFDELDIPYPHSVRVHQATVERDLSGMRFPCVIKPANAYGSHGVFLLDSVDEVVDHIDRTMACSDSDYIIAEEYDDGFEFNMMTWVVNGGPVVLDIADREKTAEVAHVTPHVSRIVYPSRLTDEVLAGARDIVERVARYVGITNGPLCMQFFWTPERGIRVCECAGRIFGYEHELLEYASDGLSIEDILLDYVYDRDALSARLAGHDCHLKNCAAGLYFHGYEGEVARIEGVPEPGDGSPTVESHVYYEAGETISHGVGDKPYVIRTYLSAPTRETIDEWTDRIFGGIAVLDGDGRNLLYRNARMSYARALR